MKKVGRNDPCPCGSALKFKRCHGSLKADSDVLIKPASEQVIQLIRQAQASNEAKQVQRQRQQGLGRPIVSREFNGQRFVAVGSNLHWSGVWKTFPDFLREYPRLVFGIEWWLAEAGKPRNELHPFLLWAHLAHESQTQFAREAGKAPIASPASGAAVAYLNLAYDLYCLAHNKPLQSKLVGRLKHRDQFEGARYEVFAAASLIRAGFEIEFENEDNRLTTHCEFTATHKGTRRQFSVEAKSRDGERHKVGRQMNRALAKHAQHERLVFIDINMPDDASAEGVQSAEVPHLFMHTLKNVRRLEGRLINGKPLPCAYLVLTNFPQHHYLSSIGVRSGAIFEGFQMPDFKQDALHASIRAGVESRERHREILDLAKSMKDHSSIPTTFDGENPEFAFGPAVQRLIIGQEYSLVVDGQQRVGELTHAVVGESEGVAHCALYFKDDDSAQVFAWPLSASELVAWRLHPDTFFGAVGQRRQSTGDPMELYEFFLQSNLRATREKLLEFMADAPDMAVLQKLDQPQLAREYAIRCTSSTFNGQ